MSTTHCAQCRQPFEPSEWQQQQAAKGNPIRCPACSDAEIQRRAIALEAEQREVRAAEWRRICPAAYQECQPGKLPTDASRTARNEAFEWRMEHGGLGIIGRASGQGKSKIICAVARRYFLVGVNVELCSASDFALECAGKYDSQLLEWLTPMRSASLLVFDDLGKDELKGRVASAFEGLVEYRTSRGKPILFTGNFDGEELSSRLGERGPFIVRRLADYCRIIAIP